MAPNITPSSEYIRILMITMSCIHLHFQILVWRSLKHKYFKMIRFKTKTKEEFCQSRYYKDWNPDFMADYNRYFIQYNGTKNIFASNFNIEVQISCQMPSCCICVREARNVSSYYFLLIDNNSKCNPTKSVRSANLRVRPTRKK